MHYNTLQSFLFTPCEAPSTWQALEKGLFFDEPHLLLQENFWDAERSCAVSRYIILDARSRDATEYASYMVAYSDAEYRDMLGEKGFVECAVLRDEEYPVGAAFAGELLVYKGRYVQ